MTLIEATLQVREDLTRDVKVSRRGQQAEQELINIQLSHWVTIAVEIAELTSKVLDWRTPNTRFVTSATEAKEDIDEDASEVSASSEQQKVASELGTPVCKRYLDFIEEIS